MNPVQKVIRNISVTINDPEFTEDAVQELLGKLEEVGNDIAIIARAIATEHGRNVTSGDIIEAFWKLRK